MIPGGVIGFLVARGNVHVINLQVICLANAIFYAGLSYWLLKTWGKHPPLNRRKESQANPDVQIQSWGGYQDRFREGLRDKRYASPITPEANKPKQ